MDLTTKTCTACEGGIAPLTQERLQPYLKEISPMWTLSSEETSISRAIKFKTFMDTIAFVNRVAQLAEGQGHHPDMTILYNTLKITLSTHSIGGLSENDFILAAKIDELNRC